MKSVFRVVGGLDFDAPANRDDKRALAEDRKRARPLLREWSRRIDHHIMAGMLLPIDGMIARELQNYPSANHGRCFAGRKRIAAAIGTHPGTVDNAIRRMEACGLLQTRRGGPGKTATRFFCCNGRFVFGGEAFLPFRVLTLESEAVLNLESVPVAHKPSEQAYPSEHYPPLSPASSNTVLDGEIVNSTISFEEFWTISGRQGQEGFARAQWRKLKPDDIAAISDRLQHDQRAIRRGVWSGTWLKDRLWLHEEPSESADEGDSERAATPRFAHAEVGSELWRRERERLRAAGETSALKLMDDWACQGKGVTVRVSSS